MKTERFAGAVASNPAPELYHNSDVPKLAIGDRVLEPSHGIIVDIDEDAVVVARRNASGRCMELVFVGDAVKALRAASRALPHK
jgi:hypothetical protein